MFGLREEILGGMIAVALFILLGAGLYVRHISNVNDELELKTAQQATSIRQHEQNESDLRADAAKKERSYAENTRQKAAIAAELAKSHSDLEDLRQHSPAFRQWGDTDLPDDYVARLRAGTGVSTPGRDQAVAPSGAAAGNTDPRIPGTGQTEEQRSGGLRRHL